MPKFSWHSLDWIALVIIVIGAVLRLYNLEDTVLFLGDQGRDALIARRILVEHRPVLIGPVTSVGNMYLGPFYYYFMVPFLALTYPNPIGPVYGVALINCISIVGLYFVVKKWFNRPIAILSILIYSLMPVAITLSRFSWNPNLSAPVAVLLLYGILEWIHTHSKKSFAIIIIALSVMIQLHYVAGITIAVFGGVWIWSFMRSSIPVKKHLLKQLGILAAFLMLAFVPIIIFDIRHDFMISQRFSDFFTAKEGHLRTTKQIWVTLKETEGRASQTFVQILTGFETIWDKRIMYLALIASGIFAIKNRKHLKNITPIKIVLTWLIMTVVFTSLYTSTIFDHYIAFTLPITAIFWAWLLHRLYQNNIIIKSLAVLLFISLTTLTYPQLTTLRLDGSGFSKYQNTVNTALPYLKSPYNIALLSADRDHQAMNYRYFFVTSPNPPKSADQYQDLNQLVVIDEVNTNDPFSNPAHELQAPGLRKLEHKVVVPDGPTLLFYSQ